MPGAKIRAQARDKTGDGKNILALLKEQYQAKEDTIAMSRIIERSPSKS